MTRWILALGLSSMLAGAAWAGPTTTSAPGTTTTSSTLGTSTTTTSTGPATTTTSSVPGTTTTSSVSDTTTTSTAPPPTTTSTSTTSTTLAQGKVEVCHKGNTISISVNALDAHRRHGDSVCPCHSSEEPEEEQEEEERGDDDEARNDDGDEREGKVAVCHNGRETKRVSARRAEKHLRHGDRIGSCA